MFMRDTVADAYVVGKFIMKQGWPFADGAFRATFAA